MNFGIYKGKQSWLLPNCYLVSWFNLSCQIQRIKRGNGCAKRQSGSVFHYPSKMRFQYLLFLYAKWSCFSAHHRLLQFPPIPLKMNLSLKWSQQINDNAKNTDLESISVAGWWRDMKDRVAYLVPSVSPIGTFPVPTGCSSALPKLVFNLKG